MQQNMYLQREITAARELYRHLGFNEEGIRENYYQNPDDDAVVMLINQ